MATVQQVNDLLAKAINEVTAIPFDEIDYDCTFAENGLDSLDLQELAIYLEDYIDIKYDEILEWQDKPLIEVINAISARNIPIRTA